MDASTLLSGIRIVPVVVIDDVATAVPLAETLCDNGLMAVEVTLRTPAALEAIEQIAAQVPQALVGAGSVRGADQFARIADAGARFAVSPGSTDELLSEAAKRGMPLVPGAVTATEMMRLYAAGYTLQKFFPAELAGGLAVLKAVSAPLPEIRFFPTGGITPALASDYLAFDRVVCLGGSWVAPARLLARHDFAAIGKLALEAAQLAAPTGD